MAVEVLDLQAVVEHFAARHRVVGEAASSIRIAGYGKIIFGVVCGVALMSLSPWASGDPQPTTKSTSVIGKKFWPSEFGADDQRGAANRITPEKVISAARLINKGEIYQLGRLYEHGMPLPGKRHFSLTIPGLPTGGPQGSNQLVSNDELFSGQIGQVGTQFRNVPFFGISRFI